ncbi:MAG TPA: T9SS type A sorting domain-containing protein [Bacteroidales bacterium]|nr:T9SS type A sorting domain-containing protein [Bacteroidales bacterium]
MSQALTINGNLTITSGSFNTNGYDLTLKGNLSTSGTFTANASSINIAGTSAQSIAGFTTTGTVSMTKTSGTATFTGNVNGGALTINGSGGTLNLGTGLIHTFSGNWTRSAGTLDGGSSTLNIGGNVLTNGGSFTPGTGTVNYNGTTSPQSTANVNYYNVVLSGSGSKTLQSGTTSISGDLTFSGTASASAVVGLNITGSVTISAGTTFSAGSHTHNIGLDWINNGTFDCGTSTVVFNGAVKTQYLGGEKTSAFYNLTISGGDVILNCQPAVLPDKLTTVRNALTIVGGNKLTIPADQQLTVKGITNFDGTECLVLDCASDGTTPSGSFIDNGTISGSGTAKVDRYFDNNGTGWDWHFLSSPVSSQPIIPSFAPEPTNYTGNISAWYWASPVDWDFYYFNPYIENAVGNFPWVNMRDALSGSNFPYNSGDIDDHDPATGAEAGFGPNAPAFAVGRGYLAAYDEASVKSFSGKLNTGNINIPVVTDGGGWNLVGNPYPSSIDWTAASGWGRSVLTTNDGYDYYIWNDDYGEYGAYNSSTAAGTNGASRYIAPEQAFFVVAAANGNLTVNNAARVHSSQAWLKSAAVQNNVLRLELTTNKNSYRDEVMIDFNDQYSGEGGSYKFGSLYAEAPELWSVKNGISYTIDRYKEITSGLAVHISAKCGVTGAYTLTATNIGDFSLSNIVYLEDLKTGTKVDLKAVGSYSFTGSPNDNKDRFRVTFAEIAGAEEPAADKPVYVYSYGNEVYINASRPEAGNCSVYIYDALGRVVSRGNYTPVAGNHRFTTLATPGAYIVKVISDSGIVTAKIIIP